jgi:hypothetical protein
MRVVQCPRTAQFLRTENQPHWKSCRRVDKVSRKDVKLKLGFSVFCPAYLNIFFHNL